MNSSDPETIQVDWQPEKGNPSSYSFSDPRPGVYVIYRHKIPLDISIVYVGQGKERNPSMRAKDHLKDSKFLEQNYPENSLFVTWAFIEDEETRNGVERWLGESRYDPEIKSNYPKDPFVKVNLPVLVNCHGMALESLPNER